MSKKFLIAGLLAAAVFGVAVAARAADLPTKAPIFATIGTPPCQVATASTPLSCSGFYVGGGIAGAGSNADIIGSGVSGSVFAGGITPTATIGYQYVQGNWIFGIEQDVGYSVNTGASANAVGGPFNGWRFTQDFKVGGNLAGMLGTQQPITVPAALANAILGPYAHVGVSEWQLGNAWAAGNVSGAGVLFDLGPKIFGDFRYSYTNFNGAKANGVTVNNDQSLLMTVNYKF